MRSPASFTETLQVADAVELFGQFGELVVVGGEEGLGAGAGVDVLDDGPGQRQPVVGGGAAADFVEHDEAARRGGVQDNGRLGHLDHEGGAAAGQIVGGADAGEDAVDERQDGGIGGNKRTHLRQDGDQRGLPQIGGLAAHVGSGDDGDQVGIGIEVKVVGDEAAGVLLFEALDDGMAAGEDAHLAVIGKRGAGVAVFGGHLGQRGGHVDFGDGGGGGANALGVRGSEFCALRRTAPFRA